MVMNNIQEAPTKSKLLERRWKTQVGYELGFRVPKLPYPMLQFFLQLPSSFGQTHENLSTTNGKGRALIKLILWKQISLILLVPLKKSMCNIAKILSLTVTRFTLRSLGASVQQFRKKNQQYFNPLLSLLLKKQIEKLKVKRFPIFAWLLNGCTLSFNSTISLTKILW